MMFANPKALEASSLSLHTSGLQGLAGPTSQDWKLLGLNSGEVFLKTNGDVAQTFSFALDGVSAITLKLPPPWNIVASYSAQKAKEAVDGTRNFLKLGVTSLGRYLPLGVAEKAIQTLQAGQFGTAWKDAGKDKLVQFIRTDCPGVLELAIKAGNSKLAPSEQLNMEIQTRFANRVYQVAIDSGATPWQAAAAAAQTLYDGILARKNAVPSAWTQYQKWVTVVGGSGQASLSSAWAARAEKDKLQAVSSKDAAKVPRGDKKATGRAGGTGVALGVGAGLLALTALAR